MLKIVNNIVLILGGGFDPFHYGHLELIQKSSQIFQTGGQYLLPTSQFHPQKKKLSASSQQRLDMLNLVCQENSSIKILPYEINKNEFCYTVDTINELKKGIFKNKIIYYIIGEDQLEQLDKWKDYQSLIQQVNFICFKRHSSFIRELPSKITQLFNHIELLDNLKPLSPNGQNEQLIVVNTPITNINSTQLKKDILNIELNNSRERNKLLQYIPKPVLEFMMKNKIYARN